LLVVLMSAALVGFAIPASAVTKVKTKVYAEAFSDTKAFEDIDGFLVFVGSKSPRCEKDRQVTVIDHEGEDPSTNGVFFGSGVTYVDPNFPTVGLAVVEGNGAFESWYRFTVAKVRRGNVVCLARTGLFFYSPPPE
jgi:hypothetical protein